MKKIDRYKLFNTVSAPLSLLVFFIILYVKPGIAYTNPEYKFLFVWFIAITVGGMIINKKYYSLIESITPEDKLNEFLSRKGRIKMRTDPLHFFSKEQYDKYRKWQKMTVFFFAVITLLLFVVLKVTNIY